MHHQGEDEAYKSGNSKHESHQSIPANLTLELSGGEAVRLERIVSWPQCANERKQTSAKPATSMSQRVMPEIG